MLKGLDGVVLPWLPELSGLAGAVGVAGGEESLPHQEGHSLLPIRHSYNSLAQAASEAVGLGTCLRGSARRARRRGERLRLVAAIGGVNRVVGAGVADT